VSTTEVITILDEDSITPDDLILDLLLVDDVNNLLLDPSTSMITEPDLTGDSRNLLPDPIETTDQPMSDTSEPATEDSSGYFDYTY